jgi:16S rRNA (guanine(1405)-N(7))-methyltransferase
MTEIESLIDTILGSKKYRELDLPRETIRSLLELELPRFKSTREAVESARKKLHNIVAPYLGDPDYQAAQNDFDQAFASSDLQQVKTLCSQLLASHASTRERLPLLEDFYPRLFAITGQPQSILDLACGLNPFAFPWMGLPLSTRYHAYDMHTPRVELINHYFKLQGLAPLAETGDILVNPPAFKADLAIFFKEAHRFEQRQHGCNRAFWQALPVRWLLVSLPTANLTGHHSLLEQHRRLVYDNLAGMDWPVQEVILGNEIIFIIQKTV